MSHLRSKHGRTDNANRGNPGAPRPRAVRRARSVNGCRTSGRYQLLPPGVNAYRSWSPTTRSVPCVTVTGPWVPPYGGDHVNAGAQIPPEGTQSVANALRESVPATYRTPS